jgi:hypothetical protein
MQSAIKKTFRDQEIVLDGSTTYVNCTFINCRFIYLGGDAPFVNCRLDNPNVTFAGEAAKVMAFMHNIGMMQPVQSPQPPPALQQMPDGGSAH